MPPAHSDSWVALSIDELPVALASSWVGRPDCGAIVTFCGTARDHSIGRPGVVELEYEAYEDHAESRLARLIDEVRARWGEVGRVALLHRVGVVPLGEAAVVVAVSAPHRDVAFDAARFAIDALKSTVPIWKRERWSGGESWGLDGSELLDAGQVGRREADA